MSSTDDFDRNLTNTMSKALSFTEGPNRGLRKEPDAFLHTPSQAFPTLVAEVGWSESYNDCYPREE